MSLRSSDSDGDDGEIVAEINVTPLTDIFLVLLIIFMVTSTALNEQGTQVNLPRAGGGGTQPSGVIVTLTADRKLEIDGQAVASEEFVARLRKAIESNDSRSVILRGDRKVVLEEAVEIMTLAKEAGAERIALATEPKPSGR